MHMSWLQSGILAKIPTRKNKQINVRQANACLLKVAQFAGTLEDYERAIEVFERVASKSLDNNLTKWSVREYLFKCMICVLCLEVISIFIQDSVRSKSSLERYLAMDPTFKGTREYTLCDVIFTLT